MFRVSITYEGQKNLGGIQKSFEGKLSQDTIEKTISRALNITANRARGFLTRRAREQYTVSNKYLTRMSKLTKPSKPTRQGLFAELSYSAQTLPFIAFKFKDRNQKGFVNFTTKLGGVELEIQHGKSFLLQHAFVKKMKSGHVGIWGHGRYIGKKFRYMKLYTSKGKPLITEMKTVSPFTMFTNKKVEEQLVEYISVGLPKRLQAMLQQEVDKVSST
jgi:hypothetical protein